MKLRKQQELEEARLEFQETLENYTDHNLVSFMSIHNVTKSNHHTAKFVNSYGVAYAGMIYEECLKELSERKSPLLKGVL